MVSSIVPGAAGATTLGVDPRYTRNPAPSPQSRDAFAAPGDRVEVSNASLAAARESVREAMAQVEQALSLGHEAQALLVKVQGFARSGVSQEDLAALLKGFSQRVEDAAGQGAKLVTGASLTINAEPGAPLLTAQGMDLRLKSDPRPGDIFQFSPDAQVGDPDLFQAAQTSMEALQQAMVRLSEVARSLEAHQGFIVAAQSALASSVRPDLDTESARLMALQVRQGLEGANGASIANAEPQAVLALFRA